MNMLYKRNIKLITVLLLLLAVLFSVSFASKKVYAKNSLTDQNKLYKSVMIYGGDTFETIAEKNITNQYSSVDKYIREIKQINHITQDSQLVPGNHIIVPYYEEVKVYEFVINY